MKISKYNLYIEVEDRNDLYLIFNTLSGSTFKVDHTIKENLINNQLEKIPQELKDEFINHGIIINNGICEDNYIKYLNNKEKFDNTVLGLTILLTEDCNLRCVYCFQGAGKHSRDNLEKCQSKEKILNFIKKQSTLRKSEIISITLFGGEPLLNFDQNIEWLDEIKEYCEANNKKLITSIITNGTLLSNKILDSLKKYNCSTIQITLDGTKEIHDLRRIYPNNKGSFDQVISAIKLIHSRDDFNSPVVRINIDKQNITETHQLLKYLSTQNLTDCYIDFGIVRSDTDACSSYAGNCLVEEELGDVLESLWDTLDLYGFNYNNNPVRRNMFCGSYKDSVFTIAPNGDLYKCWEFVGNEKHRIGRITHDGDVDHVTGAFFDWMSRTPLDTAECRECIYLPSCGGGCGSISYQTTKSYHNIGCLKTRGVLKKQILRRYKDSL